MSKKVISSQRLPKPAGAYSVAVEHAGLVFISGQLAVDPSTGQLVGNTVAEQTEQVLKNISVILTEAGSSMDKVLKCTVFLSDISKFAEMNEAYSKFFKQAPPARTTVEGKLARPGAQVEIDAIAYA